MAENALSSLKDMKPWQRYAVIGGGGAIVVYVWYKHKQGTAASTSASGTGVDPVTGLPYAQDNTVDPLTGITYLQEAQQYGSVAAAESAVSSGASAGYGGGYGAYGDVYGYNSAGALSGVPYSTFTGTQTGSSYTSNAEWAQAATAGLTDLGYTSTDIAAALGNYLAGLPLTSGQQQIVAAADAEYGYPPAGVPAVTTAPQTPPATTGNTTPTTYTVQPGDTLPGIAKKLGVNEWALYDLNESIIGSNPNLIYPGQVFQIPPAGAQGVPPGTGQSVVPNVVGLLADQAQPILSSAQLRSTLTGPSFQTGTSMVRVITAQSPSAGSHVAAGTNVTLTYKVQQNAPNL